MDAALAQAEQRVQDIERSMDHPPALVVLAQRLGLTRFERDVVLMCGAMELDTRVASLCARAQDDHQRPFPTFALALALFHDPDWSALSPHRPLRAWRLIEVHQPAATPLVAAPLRIDERIVHYLKGLNQLDDRLDGLASRVPADAEGLAPSQRMVSEAVVHTWRNVCECQLPMPIVQFVGPDPASKLLVAAEAARAVGCHLYRLPVEHIPDATGEAEGLARLWQRESRLLPLALYLEAGVHGPGGAGNPSIPRAVERFLACDDSLVFLAVRESVACTCRPQVTFDVSRPTTQEQRQAWRAALGPDSDVLARRLAGQFHLNLPLLRQAVATARSGLQADADVFAVAGAAWDFCRLEARPRVAGLAERLNARACWGDLVLPESVERVLRQLAAQVRHRALVYGDWGFERVTSRGLGISALFAGPSGTGKTMAAEVLANDLGLDLFRIDLSAVVSKYIGETEKNLCRLFDAFEEAGAILFFDEADALFGKRTEVRDSHDRYANIEVSYLLQRMESYRGLAILATNFKAALDAAFLRRLRFVVEFPMPGGAERRRIWANVFPRPISEHEGVPTEGLDLVHLGRLDLAGGNIHSAALNAAFRAAEAGTPVRMAEVLAAVREEYVKLERPVHESEFRWQPAGGGRS
jgi:hypothetical protein